jgi:hypothetical protein
MLSLRRWELNDPSQEASVAFLDGRRHKQSVYRIAVLIKLQIFHYDKLSSDERKQIDQLAPIVRVKRTPVFNLDLNETKRSRKESAARSR